MSDALLLCLSCSKCMVKDKGLVTLSQQSIHFVLGGDQECDADLFQGIAGRCPSSFFSETNSDGCTPLHLACYSLARHKGRDSEEICKYLFDKCPAAVRVRSNGDHLPISIIKGSCDYRVVREVLVCLLREYPESIDKSVFQTPFISHPRHSSSIRFIRNIKPHLDEEKELKETVASLNNSTSSLAEAVTCTNDKLMRSTFAVFDSWATSFINTTEDRLGSISVKLQDICNEGLESDE